MKIEYLVKIIHRIQHDIHCPKCQQAFDKDNIEILSVHKGRQVEFASLCHQCGSHCRVLAVIEKAGKVLKASDKATLFSVKKINPREVGHILKNFNGSDVNQLF